MPVKLTSAHYRVIGIALAVAVVSLVITLRYFRQTFPEASLDLRVNREDSASIAQAFLSGRGLAIDHYRHTVVFSYDDYAKLYLERTLGLERLNELTVGPVHLWRWSHRWFKPQQQEEFAVDVAPTGQLIRFSHVIPEGRAGKSLDAAGARAIAEAFLTQTMKRDLGGLELLESQSNRRPARTDHAFTWKQKSVPLGAGSLRISVSVSGDDVTGYSEFVKIPEDWSRAYEKLRSRNESAQLVGEVFFYLLSIAMVVMLVLRLRDHDVPVRTSLGFALAGAILYFLSRLNDFPLAESSYRTTDSYSSFVVNYFTGSTLAALGVAVVIFFLVAAAEPEYRHSFPHVIALRRYFSWKGLRTRSFFMSNVIGLTLAFFFFAYQTIFYFYANKLGAWAPSDIPFTNQLNTRIPWIAVLFMGFFPAVSEEMQFRAFAVPFLAKFVRSIPVAIILAAFSWGFLHSAYPNEPFFIRGIEVGLGGIVIGFVMLRFGILATLIWHYSVDALYSAFLLLRSPNHYLMTSGAITAGIMLIPLTVALICYLRTGTFEGEEALTNAQNTSPLPRLAELQTPTPAATYRSFSRGRLRLAGLLTVAFIAVAFVPVYRFGEEVKVRMTAQDALRAADAFLRTRGVDPAKYHHVVRLFNNVDPLAVRYLVEHVSVKNADQVYRRATQMLGWEVRYFRPLEIHEHHVFFDASNAGFVDHRQSLDEDSPGASLEASDARSLAERALVDHGYRVSEFELKDSRAEKRKARTDYHFVWQAKQGDPRNVADAQYLAEVDIAGSEVVSVSDRFKLPEEWERRQRTTGLVNSALSVAGALLVILVATRMVFLFVSQVRRNRLPWRAAAGVGAAVTTIVLLSELNAFPTIEQSYSTSIPLATFWLQTGIALVLVPVLSGLAVWVLVALALSLYPEAQSLLRRSEMSDWGKDAAAAVILGVAMAAALSKLSAVWTSFVPAYFPPRFDLDASYLNTWSPALDALLSAVLGSVVTTTVVGLAIAAFRSGWSRRTWWFWLALLLLLIALGPAHAHSVREFLIVWIYSVVSFAAIIFIMTLFFRNNALAYLATIFCLLVARPIQDLLSQAAKVYMWNGLLLGGLSLMILAWLLLDKTLADHHAIES
ncbi:MAG TPA: CPBP family intramembrane glutamic endopeptidase [Terriglobales bacterium]|nr:CPBP family intramembrane glutamic endopeptidase [Terriglobales bacterium]